MRNKLRKIIRKNVQELFEAIDGGILDDAMTNLQNQISSNIENLESIKKTMDQDIKNKENELKGHKQLKSQLPAQNADRQGLERQIPAKQKEIDNQKKQTQDIDKAKKGFEKAQAELEKQQIQIAQKAKGDGGTQEILPSLQSPI